MYKWSVPTVSEIVALTEEPAERVQHSPAQRQVQAEREWMGAIAALNQMLQQTLDNDVAMTVAATQTDAKADTKTPTKTNSKTNTKTDTTPIRGILLSGPVPVIDHPQLVDQFSTWTFTVAATGKILRQLMPADPSAAEEKTPTSLMLLPDDPLAGEQFCLALTPEFSLAMVLGEAADGQPAFLFSFDPEVVGQVWRSLEVRLLLTAPYTLKSLEPLVKQFAPVTPSYRTVTQFSRLMLANLPELIDFEAKRTISVVPASGYSSDCSSIDAPSDSSEPSLTAANPSVPWSSPAEASLEDFNPPGLSDTELLQAIAHEVRTPLTTIRTLTRLLLKRKDLNADVIKRLKVIDQECTEQIDRFNLIFKAVELQTNQTKSHQTPLAAISLTQLFQDNIPRWQQQASQHNHILDVVLPAKMPMVVTDPTMLDQALTGLVDRITHTLPPGSHIQLKVTLAGHQLKVQFESQPQVESAWQGDNNPTNNANNTVKCGFAPVVKSLGQLLMFQPETGNLSLNMTVTKNLFQALGGKLIVRQRPQQGEELTVFLPLLETRNV